MVGFMENQDRMLERARWASRRGMLELDLVLSAYVENRYLKADQEEKDLFFQLLSCEDQDLFAWFIQSKPADAPYQKMVKIILDVKNNSL